MTQVVATNVFKEGQTVEVNNRGTWTVLRRTKSFVTLEWGFAIERCKVMENGIGEEYIMLPRHDVLKRRDTVYAPEAQVSESEVKEVEVEALSEVEPVEASKEEKTMAKVTVKELRAQVRESMNRISKWDDKDNYEEVQALFRGYQKMTKAELEAALEKFNAKKDWYEADWNDREYYSATGEKKEYSFVAGKWYCGVGLGVCTYRYFKVMKRTETQIWVRCECDSKVICLDVEKVDSRLRIEEKVERVQLSKHFAISLRAKDSADAPKRENPKYEEQARQSIGLDTVEPSISDLDEEYSDYAGDNAHPEEDIPLDRESHEVKKEESAITQAVAPKLFAVGQQFKINRRGTWTVQKRTKCFVIIASGFTLERCKVREDKAGNETIVVQRRDVLGRSDIVKASDALVSEPAVAEVVKPRKKSRKSKSASTEGKSRLEKIVEAVKAAETQEAIEKILSECTKKELHEVLKAECGSSERLEPNTERKALMVESYTRRILLHREVEPFRNLDLEGKYEHLTSAKMQKKSILSLIFALKWDEVKELCGRLGVNPDMDREYLPLELIHKLRAVCKKQVIRGR